MNSLIEPEKGKTKFIFFSGKGGVGKSTMSCATAVWLARKGYKTLIVTTDPAPNLGDIFGQAIGHKITPIRDVPGLFATEINPDIASQEYRDRMVSPLKGILDQKQLDAMTEQLKSPCVDEVAAFDSFIEFMDDPQYDAVVFDTAPTGHTIRLLELPSGWSTELDKGGSTCIGPSSSLQGAKVKYKKAIGYLQDGKKTSFIFVLKPERSSILETNRSMEELSKLGIKTNSLIINGVLPASAATDAFFRKKKEGEDKMLEEIKDEFVLNKMQYPLQATEINGVDALASVASLLYEGQEENMSMAPEEVDGTSASVKSDLGAVRELMRPANGTRYIFFTGKGGVGKSTLACATSVHLADQGLRTLIVTTDPASHLQEIFGQEVGPEPTPVAGVTGLDAVRIDQRKALEEYRKRILDSVKDQPEDIRKSVEEDLSSPCAEEMSAFEKFMSYFELRDYQVVIFDTAPTGHTLRLLELPSDWKGFIDLGTLAKNTSEATRNKYASVIETMRSGDKSTFVFVVYPEYTPIIEAWRASEELSKQVGIHTALVAVNYILPKEYGHNSFFESRRRQQEKYLAEIEPRFHTPLLLVPLLDQAPEGVDNLRSLAAKMFEG
ncbi:MAG: TRC40/GET3/ArsA family transport-energizing ATPase [Methanomassiliicoccus sp.]|nr:TRC40/GET3/ArsA family transport-energizing ATPase [Methanomassiliicoccus sp.]